MIKFSPKNQAFYDIELKYSDLPDDLIEVTSEQHSILIDQINSGCIIFADLTASPPRPDQYHIWNGIAWVDQRTDEQKRDAYLLTLKNLSQKQFRMMLSNNKLPSSENSMYVDVKATIGNITDATQKEQVEIAFEYADYFSRTDPLVIYMCSLLGLIDEQVDAIWEAAMSI